MSKCTKDNWCRAMEERIKGPSDIGGGIYTVEVVNPKERTTEVIGACYKTRTTDRGLMLNFCPWCGERIYENKIKGVL